MIAANRISDATSTRPPIPRILVGMTALCWLVFASAFPLSLHGLGIAVLLAMIAVDVVLGISTGWLAFAPTSRLDERQAGVRDRAYRVGFRLVGAGVLLMVVLSIAGAILKSVLLGNMVQSSVGGISPRTIIALLELLAIAPSAMIAWSGPTSGDAGNSIPSRWLPLVAVPAVGLVWLAVVAAAPTQSTAARRLPDGEFSMGGATCGHFSAVKEVAAGFGGTARLEAEACWNGHQAFTIGDPGLPRPSAIPPDEWTAMNQHLVLTSCAPLAGDDDFGVVDERCSGTIDANGTLHLRLLGHITWLPRAVPSRNVAIDLVVTRDGKVVTFH